MCDGAALPPLNHHNAGSIAPPLFVRFSRGNHFFEGAYILFLMTYDYI